MNRCMTTIAFLLALSYFTASLTAQVTISGSVVDQSDQPIASAEILIEPQNPPNPVLAQRTKTNKSGVFSLTFDLPPGEYFLSITAEGFQKTEREPLFLETGQSNTLAAKLFPIAHFTVEVRPIEENEILLEKAEISRTLSKWNILNIPITRTNDLQKMVGGMHGSVIDPSGKVHFYGSPADHQNWLLDPPFNITDPVSGLLEANLIPEAISSIDLLTGRYSVEHGKGYGTLLIHPETGGNKLNYGVTNFVPGIEFNKGLTITSWDPRIYISGPLKKDWIWFHNSSGIYYSKRIFTELPEGEDRTSSWSGNNLFTTQANISPRNVVTSNFLVNYTDSPYFGLSPLHPYETTTNDRDRVFAFNTKYRFFPNSQTIFELGYGRYSSFFRKIPQGHGLLEMTPFGNRGYAPFDISKSGKRDQFVANMSLPSVNLGGNHQFKFGTNVDRVSYWQDISRTGFKRFRLNGTATNLTVFGGNGRFDESNLESSFYLQDSWTIKPRMLFAQLGTRWDHDRLIAENRLTSRFSIVFMPPWLKSTKLSAGFGTIPAPSPINLFARHKDQYSILTNYELDGITIRGGEFVTTFLTDPSSLLMPTAVNYSIGIEQRLPKEFYLQANYLRKISKKGYTFVPTTTPTLPFSREDKQIPDAHTVFYELKNVQSVDFVSYDVSVDKKVGKLNWYASYMWSRGLSNAALNPFIEDPIIFSNTAGPMPWDAPHRLVSGGFFELSKKNALAYYVEYRTGFPFTSGNDEGIQVGEFNDRRFPDYLNLNLHFERKLKLFGHNWAVRLGIDNVFNRGNYSLVNSNIDVPGYPIFYGKQPIKPVVRIRWLGK
ncbi:MAG: carboxypeptidase regulatory-like domain-containing protein [Candidatus Paceibacterota bacterium]